MTKFSWLDKKIKASISCKKCKILMHTVGCSLYQILIVFSVLLLLLLLFVFILAVAHQIHGITLIITIRGITLKLSNLIKLKLIDSI